MTKGEHIHDDERGTQAFHTDGEGSQSFEADAENDETRDIEEEDCIEHIKRSYTEADEKMKVGMRHREK